MFTFRNDDDDDGQCDCWEGNKLISAAFGLRSAGIISGLRTSGAQFGLGRPPDRSCIQHSLLDDVQSREEKKELLASQVKKERKTTCMMTHSIHRVGGGGGLYVVDGRKKEKVVWRVLPSPSPAQK